MSDGEPYSFNNAMMLQRLGLYGLAYQANLFNPDLGDEGFPP